MDKLKMQTPNMADENYKKLAAMFPNAVTETIDENGEVVRAIDKDILMQEISCRVVDGREERYQFTWPDKKKSISQANSSIKKTLRPCRMESANFNETENLYIEGDNLEILKLLQETYLGKFNLIYIDPPYNTGNDILYTNDYSDSSEEYENKYEVDVNGNKLFTNTDMNGRYHTNWLNMIVQRVRLSKNLLSDDGFFLIAIDHNELFNLGQLCDEVFGFSNRIGIITVVHKPEGRNQAKFMGPSNEFMLVYAKNESMAKLQNVVIDPDVASKFDKQDSKGNYRLQNFIRMTDGKLAYRTVRPKFWYAIYVDPADKRLSTTKDDIGENAIEVFPKTKVGVEMSWKVLPDTAQTLIKNGELEVTQDKDGFITIMEKIRETQVIKTHWIRKEYNAIQYGTKIVNELLGANIFDFPKSIYLIEDVVRLFCPKDGYILDFFSGSGTTGHATMLANSKDNGNRKFIVAQIPASCDGKSEAYKAGYKNICEIGKERIRRAGLKIKEDSPLTTQNLDTGFRVLKCDSTNMKKVFYNPDEVEQTLFDNLADNIKEDRTAEDLLFQVMLDLGVLLSSKIEETEICGKRVFNVAGGFLYACFDTDVSDDVVRAIAEKKPYYAVFRDAGMINDSVMTNFDQIFAAISPSTVRKVL
ncbi:MAG: site-specific DNA-methyltransferase [Eubacteriales bacterium]|nr:site-specific DNA-methyltransferase [Eubacteriales bacterium]